MALWGIIFYRIFMAMGDKEEEVVQGKPQKIAYFKMVNHQKDRVLLTFDYRDPFASLQNVEVITHPVGPNQLSNSLPAPILVKAMVNWSAITYTGYINNLNTKQKLAMITLNGKELMLAEGQSLNGIKLLKHAGDSIRVAYQKETKYIRLR